MECKICGAPLTVGEMLCKNCGASNVVEEISEIKVESNEEKLEIDKPKKGNNNLLIIIGVIVTIVALFVVIYLIYSSLKAKDVKPTGESVTVITTNNYYVNYKNHTFTFNPDIKVKILDNILEITNKNWKAKLVYENSTSYDSITIDLIKETYTETLNYSINEPSLKTNDKFSYYSTNVDYNNGLKSTEIIFADETSGCWILEIGESNYQNYPTEEVISEVLKLVKEAKVTEEESKLNFDLSKIVGNITTENASY